jgi:hypothetical protein
MESTTAAKRTMSFSIEGEYVTSIAREAYFVNHDLKKAVELIWNMTATDQLSDTEHIGLCMDILAGKANIVGTYPSDDYGVEYNDDTESYDCIYDVISKMESSLEEQKNEINSLNQKLAFVLSYISENSEYTLTNINRAYKQEYGETLTDNDAVTSYDEYASRNNDMLQSFMKSFHEADKEHKYEQYGWLEPDGTYHPVEWGDHEKWAQEYCGSHYPEEQYAYMYERNETGNDARRIHTAGDMLVNKLNWILLENPYQGVAEIQCSETHEMTKAQKEFLFDYYMDYNEPEKANRLYED